jgi:predicted nucleic acid-binding protein
VAACLDSWAILSWLDGDQPAADQVAGVLERERPVISWVNLVEVNYRIARDHGWDKADRALSDLRSRVTEDLPGVSDMRSVARLKADHPIALADCFAIALAAASKTDLLTGDPEIIDRSDKLFPCQVIDLRP